MVFITSYFIKTQLATILPSLFIMKRYSKNKQKGVVLIEFAIVTPLLLLLLVGIVEFSFAYYHLNILNKSVQDGARYFSNPLYARCNASGCSLGTSINVTSTNPYLSNTSNTVQNLVVYGNTTGTGNALMPPNNGSGYTTPIIPTIPIANHIRLTATYNYNFILGNVLNNFTGLGLTNPYPLTATSVLRVQ
jgi:Flp pilus assembly protein TadG